MFENPRGGRQARNFTTNAPKILDRKSSSEQIFSRKLPSGAPEICKLLMTSLFCGHYLLLVHIEGTELPETSFLIAKVSTHSIFVFVFCTQCTDSCQPKSAHDKMWSM